MLIFDGRFVSWAMNSFLSSDIQETAAESRSGHPSCAWDGEDGKGENPLHCDLDQGRSYKKKSKMAEIVLSTTGRTHGTRNAAMVTYR